MTIHPITFTAAARFVAEHHRHHKPPQGHLFSLSLWHEGEMVGVAIVGRPVARGEQDGFTCEVTRCCTDGTKNASSKLYGACWKAARALGYTRMISYIQEDEPGTSLYAANMSMERRIHGRQWSCPSRPRQENRLIDKVRFAIETDERNR